MTLVVVLISVFGLAMILLGVALCKVSAHADREDARIFGAVEAEQIPDELPAPEPEPEALYLSRLHPTIRAAMARGAR